MSNAIDITDTIIEKPKKSIGDENDKRYGFLAIFGRVKKGYDNEAVMLSLLDKIDSSVEGGKWEFWSSHWNTKKSYTQFMPGHNYESISSHWHYDYNILLAQKHQDVESRFYLDDFNRIATFSNGSVKEFSFDAKWVNHKLVVGNRKLTKTQINLIINDKCSFSICGKHNKNGSSSMWIYNSFSKIYLLDLTKTVWQLIIMGKLKHFMNKRLSKIYKISHDSSIIEMPENHLWKLHFSPKGKFSFRKFEINCFESSEKDTNDGHFYIPSIILPK